MGGTGEGMGDKVEIYFTARFQPAFSGLSASLRHSRRRAAQRHGLQASPRCCIRNQANLTAGVGRSPHRASLVRPAHWHYRC